jgi:hypothetical protein
VYVAVAAATCSRWFSALKMEAIRSSETSVHTRSTQRHVPEDGILHSHRLETSNLTENHSPLPWDRIPIAQPVA